MQESRTINVRNCTHSLNILGPKTLKLLSLSLNTEKILESQDGLGRFWKGLAVLCDVEPTFIQAISRKEDPTREVLTHWQNSAPNNCTVKNLIAHLEVLNRFDVIDDITPSIIEDVNFRDKYPNGFKSRLNVEGDLDKCVLTVDDVANLKNGTDPVKYDAFVLFAEDDIDFTTEVVETMEKQYNLKLCVKDRDLVGGTFEHEAVTRLISERCERLIVIVSPAFFESHANRFFLHFGQTVSLEQRERKIVPCVYKKCVNIPPELKCYYMLDYTRTGRLWNFWDKLYESIVTPEKIDKRRVRQTLSDVKPATETLKPISHVKFNSMVELNKCETETQHLNSSLSANSLGKYEKKTKEKPKWLKKILSRPLTNDVSEKIAKTDCAESNKKKRGFWNRHHKKTAQLLA